MQRKIPFHHGGSHIILSYHEPLLNLLNYLEISHCCLIALFPSSVGDNSRIKFIFNRAENPFELSSGLQWQNCDSAKVYRLCNVFYSPGGHHYSNKDRKRRFIFLICNFELLLFINHLPRSVHWNLYMDLQKPKLPDKRILEFRLSDQIHFKNSDIQNLKSEFGASRFGNNYARLCKHQH
jgi:hypothetical protein